MCTILCTADNAYAQPIEALSAIPCDTMRVFEGLGTNPVEDLVKISSVSEGIYEGVVGRRHYAPAIHGKPYFHLSMASVTQNANVRWCDRRFYTFDLRSSQSHLPNHQIADISSGPFRTTECELKQILS